MLFQRLFLVVHHYPPRRVGGAELLTRRLAQWLSHHDVDVQVLCVQDITRGTASHLAGQDDMDGNVRVRRLNVTLAPDEEARFWHTSPALRAECDALVESFQPDLVHLVSGYLMGAAPLAAARARGIPTVVTLTDFWFLCPTIQLLRGDGSLCGGPAPLECARCLYDERRVFHSLDTRSPQLVRSFWRAAEQQPWLGARFDLPRRLQRLQERQDTLVPALNTADAIIALTRFAADIHIANGVDAAKITVKPDCLDLNEFDPITPRTTTSDTIHLSYFGQVTPVKGVDVLLRAFLQAHSTARNPSHLHIYGALNAEPSYSEQLRRIAGASPHITFHGSYEHRSVLNLMHNSDAVVVPSLWYENSPRVIFESFAAQRPVIGTRVGGIAEVVQDGVNGLLFERGDVQDLARVLALAIDDPALLQRLSQDIYPPRTLKQDMDDMLAVYDRVLARAKAVAEAAR